MKEMRALGAGVVHNSEDYDDDVDDDDIDGVGEATRGVNGEGRGGGGGGGGGQRRQQRVLSSDCYAPLVEAYAQASMWERAIEAYNEGFVLGREDVEPVDYRVSVFLGWIAPHQTGGASLCTMASTIGLLLVRFV